MRYLILVLLAVVLAAPAAAQTLLSATFTSGYAVANDDPDTPYETTPRTKGYSNEVGLTSSGTLYFRILQPDVLKRTINLDFSSGRSELTGTTPCRRFGSVVDDFFCAPPLFLEPPVPTPFVTFSWISTMYEWVYKDAQWVRREEPDRKGTLQPVIFNFNTQENRTTRYAALNWQLRFDEGSADQYAYWLFFSNTWLSELNPAERRDGIVAIERIDDATWVVRPIGQNASDPPLPDPLVVNRALLTQYVLAAPDSCAPGVGAHCYMGDFLLRFELTLKKVPKVR
jgi:hypothetical protein